MSRLVRLTGSLVIVTGSWQDNDVSSAFGSIGVMCSFSDLKPFYEKMGVKFHEIYADQSENKTRRFACLLEGDYTKIRQESLNPMALRSRRK